METQVFRTAIASAFENSPSRLGVTLSGGEPLLEEGCVRDCIEYVELLRPSDTFLNLSLTTNGTLLTTPLMEFLAQHDVEIHLSLDGVIEAQRHRSPKSWHTLDRILDQLRDEYPDHFAQRVRVSMLVTARTIPFFAQSVRYLLDKGVQTLRISPPLTDDPEWAEDLFEPLQQQVETVAEMSEQLWKRNGQVPVTILRPSQEFPTNPLTNDFLCSAPDGSSYTVDPDGHVWACPLFAESLQRLPPAAREAARVFDLGHVADPGLQQRLDGMRSQAKTVPVLTRRADKYSSYGQCRDCDFLPDCQVCPASICHTSDHQQFNRVPDMLCAFNQIVVNINRAMWRRNRGLGLAERFEGILSTIRRSAVNPN